MNSLIRMSCLVAVLVLSRASAADQKPALIGATRDDVLSRLGTPSGDIVAGDREVLVFSTQRVVLSAGRVVEVEDIPVEAAPPPPPPPAPATTASADSTAQPASPVADASTPAAAPAASAAQSTGDDSQSAAPAPSEPQVVIKSVRPPSVFFRTAPAPAASAANGPAPRPASVNQAPSVATTPAAVQPGPKLPDANATPAATGAGPAAPTPTTQGAARQAPAAAGSIASTTASVASTPVAATTSGVTQPDTPAAPPKQRPADAAAASAPPPAAPSFFSNRTNLITIAVIVGAIAYLLWRRRNRQLMLAATAVANSPIPAQPTYGNGARFTQDLLGKLEWKRFEELVAAYYNKTGVMATRTKSGPAAPVHIRISWKGEKRPFALVQCIAQPAGLVDAKPVQALCDVLAAEDIRRGYLVTSGKFGIGARDLAEEKHVTLLSGDIFLEKLNALPDPVRGELMHEITKGDYTTPTCPKCDVKMVHPPGNPDGWQCPQCDSVLP